MTHPVIKTDNYILITSDEEIKEGDIYIQGYGVSSNNIVGRFSILSTLIGSNPDVVKNHCKKIIAHLPLNNSSILEGVPLLPPLPMTFPTIECIGDNIWEELTGGQEVSVNRGDWSFGFGIGYNKAKEKYKDLINWIDNEILLNPQYKDSPRLKEGANMVKIKIQSISQPKLPVGFKCEMIKYDGTTSISKDWGGKPKIINGVMQGEWIF